MTLPAPTAATATKRYIPANVRKFTWVPTIASKGAPTPTELTAGTDLTAEVAEVTGFSTSANMVEVPDYGSRTVAKIPGLNTLEDSTMKLYVSSDSTDSRSLLTEGLTGFVAIYPEGIVTGGKVSIFPVTITSAVLDEVAPGDPATMTYTFAVTSDPVQNIAIPTS